MIATAIWNPPWRPVQPNRPGASTVIGVGVESQIYSERNWYDNGHTLFSDARSGTGLGGVFSDGDFIGSSWSVPSSISPIGSSYVDWRPHGEENYLCPPILSASEAANYVLEYAGAKYHLINPSLV